MFRPVKLNYECLKWWCRNISRQREKRNTLAKNWRWFIPAIKETGVAQRELFSREPSPASDQPNLRITIYLVCQDVATEALICRGLGYPPHTHTHTPRRRGIRDREGTRRTRAPTGGTRRSTDEGNRKDQDRERSRDRLRRKRTRRRTERGLHGDTSKKRKQN